MATTTTTADSVLIALRELLSERDGLAGVTVEDAPYPLGELGEEWIDLYGVKAKQRWGSLGARRREEEYAIVGSLRTSVIGSLREDVRTCRARAYAILAEIEDALRDDPTIGGIARQAELSSYELVQSADSDSRITDIDFEIGVKATLPRS